MIENVNVFKSNVRRERTKFAVNHFGSDMTTNADVLLTLGANNNVIALVHSGIDHRVTLGDQHEELSRAD